MFDVNVLKRGCPGKIPSSGKNSDLVTPSLGVAGYGGVVKLGHPNLKWIKNKLLFVLTIQFFIFYSAFQSFSTIYKRLEIGLREISAYKNPASPNACFLGVYHI